MRINAVGQLIVFLPPDILEMLRIRKVWMVMEGHQSSMMMVMMIRMAIVTKTKKTMMTMPMTMMSEGGSN